jgi:hypothetical protein
MLHTLSPLAGGSPHIGLQTVHFVQRTFQDALHFIHYLQPHPTLAAGAFTLLIPIYQYSNKRKQKK